MVIREDAGCPTYDQTLTVYEDFLRCHYPLMCIYPTTLWIESEAGGLILQNRYHLNSAGVVCRRHACGGAEDTRGIQFKGKYQLLDI